MKRLVLAGVAAMALAPAGAARGSDGDKSATRAKIGDQRPLSLELSRGKRRGDAGRRPRLRAALAIASSASLLGDPSRIEVTGGAGLLARLLGRSRASIRRTGVTPVELASLSAIPLGVKFSGRGTLTEAGLMALHQLDERERHLHAEGRDALFPLVRGFEADPIAALRGVDALGDEIDDHVPGFRTEWRPHTLRRWGDVVLLMGGEILRFNGDELAAWMRELPTERHREVAQAFWYEAAVEANRDDRPLNLVRHGGARDAEAGSRDPIEVYLADVWFADAGQPGRPRPLDPASARPGEAALAREPARVALEEMLHASSYRVRRGRHLPMSPATQLFQLWLWSLSPREVRQILPPPARFQRVMVGGRPWRWKDLIWQQMPEADIVAVFDDVGQTVHAPMLRAYAVRELYRYWRENVWRGG